MLHQMNNIKEHLEAIGQDVAGYDDKVACLKQRWPADPMQDGVAERVIRPVRYMPTACLYESIVSDCLSYFNKHFDQNLGNSNQMLALACLCGSEQVAHYLMEKLQVNCLSTEYDYMLGYVCASPNFEWAKRMARVMVEAGKSMPINVVGMTKDFDKVDIIQDIFESISLKPPIH